MENMTLYFDEFLKEFIDQLMEDDTSGINAESNFRQLSSWDSLTGMAVIVMIEDKYGVKVPENIFKSINTIGELHYYVMKTKAI
jgi:acyl carrier protein